MVKPFTFFTIFLFTILPSFAQTTVERYEKVLARLDRQKEQVQKLDIEDIEKVQKSKANQSEPYEKWTLGFEHEKFPSLDGTWLLTKITKKRMINPPVTKAITFVSCNSRLPFERRDFEKKEVIISSRGPDSFLINTKYPVTDDVYHDPNKNEDITYKNFGFKAVIDKRDITYAYTLKVLENRAYARQLWLNGRLQYEDISPTRIVAKGYEIEYSPECKGFVLDEIKFVLVKANDADFGPDRPIPFLEQPAFANEYKDITKLDSAKDDSGFKPSSDYKPYDSNKNLLKKKPGVAGLW